MPNIHVSEVIEEEDLKIGIGKNIFLKNVWNLLNLIKDINLQVKKLSEHQTFKKKYIYIYR